MILVVDLDGTIANNDHRQVFVQEGVPRKDWDKFYDPQLMKEDLPFRDAQSFFDRVSRVDGVHVVFLTGRPERTRGVTAWWLYAHYKINIIPQDRAAGFLLAPAAGMAQLIMRGDSDWRNANLYKKGKVEQLAQLRPGEPFIFIDDDVRCYEDYWRYGIVLRPPEAWAAIK
jgi:hypothetical protein